jgi:glyoxylase-like metal-dependent hydrolase (beta-lactamase superfamily II)
MKIRQPVFIASMCFGLVFAGHAQRDFSDVEIKVIPVARNVAMLEGAGGNIGVSVGDDGILVVDDQFAPLAEKISAALATLNPGKPKFVLNTHHHGDHTGGNAVFGAAGATIVAHANVRGRLVADENANASGYPVITFDESASVHFNGEEITLSHLGPGHTNGDTIVRFTGANVVHMGDQFFNGVPALVDGGGPFHAREGPPQAEGVVPVFVRCSTPCAARVSVKTTLGRR